MNVAPATDPNADGEYNVEYSVTDSDGNEATCTQSGIIYDITDPSCENDFYAAPIIDVNDKNYSVAVPYNEATFNPSYGISGVGSTAYLDPARNDGDAYHVGYARDISYTSTYHLEDGAGNTATCSWEVFVDNPNPCVYPTCDDEPPTVENCPTSFTIQCADNANCGCGKWTPPTFKDDKFVKDIKVYIDGVLHETYDNNNLAHTAPDSLLAIGNSNVTYVAQDMHGKTARCQFNVIIEDKVAPVLTCPSSETISATGETVTYSYNVSATDACVFTDVVKINLYDDTTLYDDSIINAQAVIDAHSSKAFEYEARDPAGNLHTCQWTVTVADNNDPVITCPDDIEVRADQGGITQVATFTVTAEDASTDVTVATSHASGSNFNIGETTVTAVATDEAGLTDTCQFKVTVLPSYPSADFGAVLTRVIVSEGLSGKFGADIEFNTYTTAYHRVSLLKHSHIEGTNHNDEIVVDAVEASSDCAMEAPICTQTWNIGVEFDTCTVTGSIYAFTSYAECRPVHCLEEDLETDFTIELSAADYCWQDFDQADVTAQLFTLLQSDHDSFAASYALDDSTPYPAAQTAFQDEDTISGIIAVSSPSVLLEKVEITNASRQFYLDAGFVNKASDNTNHYKDLSTSSLTSQDKWASFTYLESDVPIETSYYTRYSATVELTYNFGTRRRLLNIERSLSQSSSDTIDKTVTADAVMYSDNSMDTNPDDAIILMKLTKCPNVNANSLILADIIAMELKFLLQEYKLN